jgi:hypothetical protein
VLLNQFEILIRRSQLSVARSLLHTDRQLLDPMLALNHSLLIIRQVFFRGGLV